MKSRVRGRSIFFGATHFKKKGEFKFDKVTEKTLHDHKDEAIAYLGINQEEQDCLSLYQILDKFNWCLIIGK